MIVFYNSTDKPINETVDIPIYYTGLHDEVTLTEKEGKPRTIKVSRGYSISVPIAIPAGGMTWMTLK